MTKINSEFWVSELDVSVTMGYYSLMTTFVPIGCISKLLSSSEQVSNSWNLFMVATKKINQCVWYVCTINITCECDM